MEAFRTPSAFHPRLDAGVLSTGGNTLPRSPLVYVLPRAGRVSLPSLAPFPSRPPARRPPHWLPTTCTSPCSGDCGCHCHSPTPAAGLGLVPPAAGLPLMPSATTPWRAHEVSRSPDGRASWNLPGHTSLGKAWVRKAGLSPHQGPTPIGPRGPWRHPPREALCCDGPASRHIMHICVMAPRCRQPNNANEPDTRS